MLAADMGQEKKPTNERVQAVAARSWLPSCYDVIAQLGGHSMKIEDFLLAENHEEIREWVAHRLQTKVDLVG